MQEQCSEIFDYNPWLIKVHFVIYHGSYYKRVNTAHLKISLKNDQKQIIGILCVTHFMHAHWLIFCNF